MVRAEVALAARFGLAGLGLGKGVPRMAGVAGALGTVGVDPADAGVGPALLVQAIGRSGIQLHLGAVAALAAEDRHGRAGQHVGQVRVLRLQNQPRRGVVGGAHLGRLPLVAAAAIRGRDQRGDADVVVDEAVGVTRLGPVAVQAGDLVEGVGGAIPLLVQAGCFLLVAGQAFARCRRRRGRLGRNGQDQGDDEKGDERAAAHGSSGSAEIDMHFIVPEPSAPYKPPAAHRCSVPTALAFRWIPSEMAAPSRTPPGSGVPHDGPRRHRGTPDL